MHGDLVVEMNNVDLTPEEIQSLTWEISNADNYIWRCMETGKFHFADEAGMLDGTPYDRYEEADRALDAYVKECLRISH